MNPTHFLLTVFMLIEAHALIDAHWGIFLLGTAYKKATCWHLKTEKNLETDKVMVYFVLLCINLLRFQTFFKLLATATLFVSMSA